ncbi:ribokinase [Lewinella sp. 4G2]|uniref:ribokinase n=1 Tax=Lewinella sp. 4G2 TaxID=1803372 RepID=UPI000AE52E38|nr:ribokinase [Lewinella sp. 4G2]
MNRTGIVVVGSSNTDMVVQSGHLPAAGETVLGGAFSMHPGGKGANQAVAAAKLGGTVTFVARVGDDLFGRQAKAGFLEVGIDVDYVVADAEAASGVALIMVDREGENSISVALGANDRLNTEDLAAAGARLGAARYVLVQLETPLAVVEWLAERAATFGYELVLNPAPARELNDKLLGRLHLITPNAIEAELLTGVEVTDAESAHRAAGVLRGRGVDKVIITMGSQGAYALAEGVAELVPTQKVKAVDTTAAGDTFNGALVVALTEGKGLLEAVRFANRAAAYSVGILGAQVSAPRREDLG